MADRYLLESGSPDGYLLEDGSGVLLIDLAEVTLVIQDAQHAHASGNLSGSATPTNIGLTEGEYAVEVMADAPTLYWRLHETAGNLPQDSSGNENDATVSNDPVESAASLLRWPGSNANTFDNNDVISIPTEPELNIGPNQDRSVELWFQGTTAGVVQTLISKKNEFAFQVGWTVYFDASDNLRVRIGESQDILVEAAAAYLDGKSHHLVYIRDATNDFHRLYLDGVEVDSTQTGLPSDDISNSQPLKVGKINGVDSVGFTGVIDEVAFYGSALSSTRVAAHWDAGKQTNLAIADALHAHAADTLQKNPGRADDFDQSAGTWAGKTADLGGNWVEETAATGAADTVTGSVAQVVHSSPGDSANSQNMRLDGALENVEAKVRIRVDKIPTGANISANMPIRKQTGLNELYRPSLEYRTDGHIYLVFGVAAPGSSFGTWDLGVYTANDWWWLKANVRSDPNGGNFLFAKAWKDGDTEPSWLITENDDNATYMHGPGTVGLRSFVPTGVNFPITFQFDDFDVKVNQELSQVHILAIADALHAHAADNAQPMGTDLVIQDALHGHTADNVALVQQYELVIQDAQHAHAADNLALTQLHELVIADALHGHLADNLGLTQVHILAIADALHGHLADNLTITEDGAVTLAIQDALHGHAADGLTLTQAHVLAIQDALHAHLGDGLVLTQVHNLVIQDALHGHLGDNVVLSVPGGGPALTQDLVRLRRYGGNRVLNKR
jgi:hypothetical protein